MPHSQTTDTLEDIVARVLAELAKEGISAPGAKATSASSSPDGELVIDLPDPTELDARRALGVVGPHDPDGLRNLAATTNARLGVGRAGSRPLTRSLLLFQADHGVTQDAIHGVVPEEVKTPLDLFTVTSQVRDREEYLLRPDLGRRLSDEARQTIAERCTPSPDVQICVGDGLSAAAIDSNLNDIYPVLAQGLTSAGLTIGTPFFIQNARVGIMNDVNAIVGAKVLLLLIGERPGLGIADAMSVYMGYDPQPGKSDADRDLICMITTNGGTNPLEAGAYVVEVVKRMMQHRTSGVKLRELAGQD